MQAIKTVKMHPDYFTAKHRLDVLADKYSKMREPKNTVLIGRKWDAILEKDPTGQQCLNWVKDLEELLTPRKE